MVRVIHYTSRSAEETYDIGMQLGYQLPPNSVIFFYGDLGAGKTTLIKGITAGATGSSEQEVTSPTFTYLSIYQGAKSVYHFDLYRLHDADEFLSMGFDEMFDAGGICCIEWAEKIESLFLPTFIKVKMQHRGEEIRSIDIYMED